MRFTKKKWIAMLLMGTMVVTQLPASVGTQAKEKDEQSKVAVESVDRTVKKAAEEEQESVVFSQGSGTYKDAFELKITSPDSKAVIYYTTDGSDPSNPENEARIALGTNETISVTDRKADENVLSAIDPILFDGVNVKANASKNGFESTIEVPKKEDVDKCTVIKAAARYEDGTCSEVYTNTYFVGDMTEHIDGIQESCQAAGMDLSVISISMDAQDLFDSAKGIYVKGDIFNKALEDYLTENSTIDSWDAVNVSRGLDANYKQKGKAWERSTHIDYFESNGSETSCLLQQDCGIRVQGNYSRSDYQKSFRLYAREDYGKKNFKYGFWKDALDDSGEVIDKYKTIVLRNGGNCAFTTKFSDAYWQALIKDVDCDKQSARPCVVYLNGEYWGVYILQDDFRGSYVENKHGVNKDDVVIYKGDAEAIKDLGYKLDEGEIPEGESEDYYFRDLEAFLNSHDDLSNEEDYKAFCQIVDEQSVMDYYAVQVWINNKWDWPGKNWSMWKTTTVDESNPYADGRWRFMIYDVEFGGISGSSDAKANTIKESKLLKIGSSEQGDTNWDKPNVRCFALLMTNPTFRNAYKERLKELSSTIFEKEHALEVSETFKNVYQPILDQFFERFPTYWGDKQKTADMVINGNNGDTYGTWANIVSFVKNRADNIDTIVKYISKQFKDPETTPTPEVTPSAAPEETPVPTVVPSATPAPEPPATVTSGLASKAGTTETEKLADGAIRQTTYGEDGQPSAVKYKVDGVTYTLLSDNTLSYSVDNQKNLKKKSSIVIEDVVVAGGEQYKVTAIDDKAFQGLSKLKKVTVGANVKTIGAGAWKNCSKLQTIVLETKKLKKIGKDAVKGISKKAVVRCPKGKKKAYNKLFTAKTGFAKKTMKIKEKA